MMANELHCKMCKQMYLSKIYLEEFCPFLHFLHVEAGNCNNPDRSQKTAVKSVVIERVSDICIFTRKQLISVRDAALTEFYLSWKKKHISISFKYFKEPSQVYFAPQSLFLHCRLQDVSPSDFRGGCIIEQSSPWSGGESRSHWNLFCCHFCFPPLRMTFKATNGRQSSSKKPSSCFGHTVTSGTSLLISSCALLQERSEDCSENSCEMRCF